MTWPRALLVIAVCSTLGLGLTAFATADSAAVSFDDLDAPGRGGPGLAVTSQYLGVTFANASAFDYSKGPSAIENFAHSPNVAVEPCVGVEFCAAPLAAGFGAPQKSVKVWVGYSYPLSQALGVRLTAYNDSTAVGTADATLPANSSPTRIRTPLEVTQPKAVITRFEVSVTTGGGYTSGLAVDDVEFSAVEEPPVTQPPVTQPPKCGATAVPGVTLSQPAAGSAIYTDELRVAGSVQANGAPITGAVVTVRSIGGGERVAQAFPSPISASGGPFGPTSFKGLLRLGSNVVTVSATNCAGTGRSAPVGITLRPRPVTSACLPDSRYPGVYVADANNIAGLLEKLNSDFRGQVIFPLGQTFNLSGQAGIPLRPGVSLVGERGPLGERPLIRTGDPPYPYRLFEIRGPGVCIEGLHIEGPSRDHKLLDKEVPTYHGLWVTEDPCEFHGARGCTCGPMFVLRTKPNQPGSPPSPDRQPDVVHTPEPCDYTGPYPADPVLIADNELAGWTGGAVVPAGTVTFEGRKAPGGYRGPRMLPQDASRVRIERNYIHHNARESFGYGVVMSGSAYATVYGNTFDFNRHSVTSEGQSFSGYTVRFNYMLENAYTYGDHSYTPHLDVHGSGPDHYGGVAGEYHVIEQNTIRGEQDYSCTLGHCTKSRAALVLRGLSTRGLFFRNNIVVHDSFGEAIVVKGLGDAGRAAYGVREVGNRYDTDNSSELVAGDFDGDGRTDVFLTNGTSWMLSRAGVRPWEFLRPARTLRGELGFADIDNDGATDVLVRGATGQVGYYARGRSASPTPLTSSPVPARELRFGDFDGDRKTDIFYTRNGQWRIWYGATRAWANAARSQAQLANLLFGEFDDVAGTDVATIRGSEWSYSSGATKGWARLNRRLWPSFSRAVAADFDGNGKTDIAFDELGTWFFSADGRGPLQLLRRKQGAVGPLHLLLIGRFQAGTKATVVAFDPSNRNQFAIWRGIGAGAQFVRLSQQGVR